MTCPVCGYDSARTISTRAAAPILMHRLYATSEEARKCPTGAIELVQCTRCGFSWNKAFDAGLMRYGPGYENDQLHSPVFRTHVQSVTSYIRSEIADHRHPVCVVEVGAGQGRFLRILRGAAPEIARAIGFDPAFRGTEGDDGTGVEMYRRLYVSSVKEEVAHSPDLILSRHTIEHVPQPVEFLRNLLTAASPSTPTVILETPDIDWIVRNEAFEDVFYEHCSLFGKTSLLLALAKAGFKDIEITSLFSGQYLLAKAKMGTSGTEYVNCPRTEVRVQPVATDTIESWKSRLPLLAANGPVLVWGAGAKGMTFCQILDKDRQHIAGLVDINPNKAGRYIGVTGHPVIDPSEVARVAPSAVIVVNPNYAEEVRLAITESGHKTTILTLHERNENPNRHE